MHKKWWVLIGTGIAAIMIAVDFTIVNTSLANIQHDLGATMTQLQWVITSFGLSFCALLVSMGRLGDLLGRRKILYLGIIGFAVASLGAGFAMTPSVLISMRFLQGFLGASIIPCGMAITVAAFPKHQQGRALGLYGSIVGVGLAFGPALGSIIDAMLNWRWIFFINIPVVVVSLLVCIFNLEESKCSKEISIDWIGIILLIFSLGTLVYAINVANISALIAALLGFIILYCAEKRAKMPILPIPLFLNTGFLLALIIYLVSVAFSWPILFLMSLYLHNIVDYSSEIAGLLLATMTIMTAIAPALGGYFYDQKSKVTTIHSLFAISAISLFLFSLLGINGPLGLILTSFILFGIAWGIANGIAVPIALSQLPNMDAAGLVAGALTTAMNILAIFFLTVITTLFRYREHTAFTKLMLANPKNTQTIFHGLIFKQAFIMSAHFVYLVLLIMAVVFWIVASMVIKWSQWG